MTNGALLTMLVVEPLTAAPDHCQGRIVHEHASVMQRGRSNPAIQLTNYELAVTMPALRQPHGKVAGCLPGYASDKRLRDSDFRAMDGACTAEQTGSAAAAACH